MEPSVIAAVATVLAALIAGVAAWTVAKKKGARDAQVALNEGYKILINQLQEERITIARDTIIERKHLSEEVKELRVEVRSLRVTVESLRQQLIDNNIKPRE
jgi:hypothetical protein